MTPKTPVIYLDYMSTTPVDPRVIAVMQDYLGPEAVFGNPSSNTHSYGKQAASAIEDARHAVAQSVGARSQEIVFTSGATEANNLAILGTAENYCAKGNHLITVVTEHKAVLDPMHHLERQGFKVTYLPVQSDGILDLTLLEQAITPSTILASVMHVNNEVGVIQDIATIGEILHRKGVLFHVDAAQSAGKLAIDLAALSVDLMSLSAHKNYGPKGVGALYVRHKPRVRLAARTFGGGQEHALRPGTLPTHQIAAMGAAFALSESMRTVEQPHILQMRERLWNGIKDLSNIRLNGHAQKRIAGNLNVTFSGLDGDSLLMAMHGLAVSSTSACVSMSHQPSYVLKALGSDDEDAYSSIRLSIGRFTTQEQIESVITIICDAVNKLYKMKP